MHVCMYACIYTYIYGQRATTMSSKMCLCTHTHTCIYTYNYIYIYIYIYTHIYIYIYTHTHPIFSRYFSINNMFMYIHRYVRNMYKYTNTFIHTYV